MMIDKVVSCIIRVMIVLDMEYTDENMDLIVNILYTDNNKYLLQAIEEINDGSCSIDMNSLVESLLRLKIINIHTDQQHECGIFSDESDIEEITYDDGSKITGVWAR